MPLRTCSPLTWSRDRDEFTDYHMLAFHRDPEQGTIVHVQVGGLWERRARGPWRAFTCVHARPGGGGEGRGADAGLPLQNPSRAPSCTSRCVLKGMVHLDMNRWRAWCVGVGLVGWRVGGG